MDLHLGADVRQVDGTKLGAIRRIIYDPAARRVPSIVVEAAGFDDREVQVSVETIIDGDDESIEVDITREEFDSLETFLMERNVAPPPDAAFVHSDLLKDPDVPDMPAIGAASGVESIAFTPLVEERTHLPSGDEMIDSGTTVYATDGEIGHVKIVSIDEDTGELIALVVERGFFFVHDTEVPAEVIEGVRPQAIILTVARDGLQSDDDA